MHRHADLLIPFTVILTLWCAATAAEPTTWKATVVSVSDESPQYVGGDPARTPWPGRPAAHHWVRVAVKLTEPQVWARLPIQEIQLVGASGRYPLTAITHQMKPKHSAIFLPVLKVSPPYDDKGVDEPKDRFVSGGVWSVLETSTPNGLKPIADAFFENDHTTDTRLVVYIAKPDEPAALLLAKGASPLVVSLLFAVPAAEAELTLQLGSAEPVILPATR